LFGVFSFLNFCFAFCYELTRTENLIVTSNIENDRPIWTNNKIVWDNANQAFYLMSPCTTKIVAYTMRSDYPFLDQWLKAHCTKIHIYIRLNIWNRWTHGSFMGFIENTVLYRFINADFLFDTSNLISNILITTRQSSYIAHGEKTRLNTISNHSVREINATTITVCVCLIFKLKHWPTSITLNLHLQPN